MTQTIFGIRPGAQVECVIDGNYLYTSARALGFDIDFEALRALMMKDYDLRRIYYYTRTACTGDGEVLEPVVARIIDFLDYHGYKTEYDPIDEFTNAQGQRIVKSNTNTAITCNLIRAAKHVPEIILFARNEGLAPIVQTLQQEFNTRITLIGCGIPNQEPARDLRRVVDNVINLEAIMDKITFRRRHEEVALPPAVLSGSSRMRLSRATTADDRR